jgi:hypothetical protein
MCKCCSLSSLFSKWLSSDRRYKVPFMTVRVLEHPGIQPVQCGSARLSQVHCAPFKTGLDGTISRHMCTFCLYRMQAWDACQAPTDTALLWHACTTWCSRQRIRMHEYREPTVVLPCIQPTSKAYTKLSIGILQSGSRCTVATPVAFSAPC